ncbi:substrate-binding domain-containing protein [Thalassovita taeanensis]|uniref:Phosphate ABC transporter substrate-binding protein, PhoT family n=1 Tax=Thalassovita taeanensis TaxID=657014 RepID=A0A1H9JMT2_9RHOB|nr:phosphate ABC transporter substrate-binding/OmpA family protein [Thalassovita taeanensis]SEQ88136.1 phosphate ABC transporter substrate-binding protein, PhoT family [Thalassovita taeanensis]
MATVRAAVFAALFLLGFSVPVWAQDVTLISQDETVEISGTLLGFDGEYYRLDTIYGELTVDGSGVKCEGPGCPSLEDYVAELSISGAASMGEVLLPALIEVFAQKSGHALTREVKDDSHSEFILTDRVTQKVTARFHIRKSNTDEGFADLLANEADLVMSLREVRENEAWLAREAGLGNLRAAGRSRVLALDALVPILSPGNPLDRISTPDLAQVFSGDISNWAQLGGPDAPITVHVRDSKAGLGQAVEDRLLGPVGKAITADSVRHLSDQALADAVVADPFGIGLASVTEIGNAKPVALSGRCGFALGAERKTIKTEDYPLTAPMFLYLPARRLPKVAREFLSFTRSESAQLVIRRAGFTDQGVEEISINDQGDRFANAIARSGDEIGLAELQRMVQVLGEMRRLTTTFRFETGSARLDAQSRSNVAQLAQALESGAYDTRRLLFVGFSDGEGPASANQAIALRRAEAVREAVTKAAETANFERLDMQVDAFGEAMPMACDDSAWGRQVNRRVEVWLR